MSLHEYRCSRELADADPPFYALVMAAMRRADTGNLAKLTAAYPDVYVELQARYNAPGGRLPTDGGSEHSITVVMEVD
jgi:hypothetical protein